MEKDAYSGILDCLRSASGLLDIERESQLHRDVISICNHLVNSSFRIAVFGPFNYGKSTLVNAMLGNRALPIDLIPTTGAVITVKYGNELQTRITLVDGTQINQNGTDILKEFAILDSNRRMRNDVASVQVFFPHPFLQTGIELLDLPGTNDREEQDTLVRNQLLNADLVVQLLDARKLLTLGERENLRDWLIDRGIKTVVFVANFLNLLELSEQKEVQNRLRFVAESFRADFPLGFSNLYRVDALPALRARLKGDMTAASSSGLSAFETALQNIVAIRQENININRLPRVEAIAIKVKQSLQVKAQAIATNLESVENKRSTEIQIKKQAEKLIKQGFQKSVTDLRDWLALPNLLVEYQSEAALALEQNTFITWEALIFKQAIVERQQAVTKWIYQAYNFFEQVAPDELLISFPSHPQVSLPGQQTVSDDLGDTGSVAVATGIGWLLGGPVGAAVVGGASYLLNKNLKQEARESSEASYRNQVSQIYAKAASDYLSYFSIQALSLLSEYEEKAANIISFQMNEEPSKLINDRHYLKLLQSCLDNLTRELESANTRKA